LAELGREAHWPHRRWGRQRGLLRAGSSTGFLAGWVTSEPVKKLRGHNQTSELGSRTNSKGKGFFYKRIQTIEFKYRFEFIKTKIMQQHVCNKHQAIYLFSKNK
jgi:hypothetical protein